MCTRDVDFSLCARNANVVEPGVSQPLKYTALKRDNHDLGT